MEVDEAMTSRRSVPAFLPRAVPRFEHVGAGESELLVCGTALGYADPHAAVNALEVPREPVAGFTRWVGG